MVAVRRLPAEKKRRRGWIVPHVDVVAIRFVRLRVVADREAITKVGSSIADRLNFCRSRSGAERRQDLRLEVFYPRFPFCIQCDTILLWLEILILTTSFVSHQRLDLSLQFDHPPLSSFTFSFQLGHSIRTTKSQTTLFHSILFFTDLVAVQVVCTERRGPIIEIGTSCIGIISFSSIIGIDHFLRESFP